MGSDDDGAPQGSRQRPAWQIWAIVGAVAALVAVVGIVGIVLLAGNGDDGGQAGGQPTAVAAVEQLRSHLPEDLKSADDCAQADPLPYATSTVVCTWPISHVPYSATYSLFEDETSMQRSAMTLVRSSGGYGPSCESPSDFEGNGGQTTWLRDERERGTLWCYLNRNGDPVILWTDTAPLILGSAVASGPESARALLFWHSAKGQVSLEPVPSPPQLRTHSSPMTTHPQPTTAEPTTSGPTTNGPTTAVPSTIEPPTGEPPTFVPPT